MERNDPAAWQELLIDHSQFPRGHGTLPDATHEGRGENPFCGDRVTVTLRVGDSGRIEKVACQSVGCAISIASASMLAERVRNLERDEARSLFQCVHRMLAGAGDQTASDLGELQALQLVRQYPSRVKCATLAWHALGQALDADPDSGPVTTESSG